MVNSNTSKITLKELEYLIKQNQSVKINTPTGYELITDTYRKSSEGIELVFSDNTTLKCSNDHLVKFDNDWYKASNLPLNNPKFNDNENLVVTHALPLKTQEWVDFTVAAEHSSYYLNNILHHNSGKSHMIYLVIRFLLEYTDYKIMLIVPSIGLVEQMSKDFLSYVKDDFDIERHIHRITAGKDKFTDKRIVITTYQSLLPMINDKKEKYDVEEVRDYFESFEVVVNDESHKAEAASLTAILNRLVNTKFRFGLSGSLKETKCHLLQLKGLFGQTYIATTSKELQDTKVQAELAIKIRVLKYSKEDIDYLHSNSCKNFVNRNIDYQKEINFLLNHEKRNAYLVETLLSKNNNVLGLYNFHKHGNHLKELLEARIKERGLNKQVLMIHGKVKLDDREDIRQLLSENDNVILLATYGCLQEGFNAPRIYFLVFLHPYKGKIRNIQSIGRTLRYEKGVKEHAELIDIGDDLSKSTKKKLTQNHTLKHLYERVAIYDNSEFKYKSKTIEL